MTPLSISSLLAVTIFSLGAPSDGAARSVPDNAALAVASGIVGNGEESGGVVWFSFEGSDLRFEAPIDSVKDPDGLFAAAKQSADHNVNLDVRYDIESGFIDPATVKATFDIRDVTIGDLVIAGVATSADVRRTPASPAESALARALGLADSNATTEALASLTTAMADPKLPVNWRVLALKTRANTDENIALGDLPMGADRDQHLIPALNDNRAWAVLAPDDPKAAEAIVLNLEELGAYAEAMASLRKISGKWPDQDYSAAVRTGAVYRLQGQYDRALASLDDLVARKGPQVGMKFHYHRGRTLLKLGRGEEAVKEFNTGLEDQPGYAWAFAFRACALAASGAPKDALADQQKFFAILTKQGEGSRETRAQSYDLKRAGDITEQLRAAAYLSPAPKIAGLCDSYWDDGDTPRARSRLLPPA